MRNPTIDPVIEQGLSRERLNKYFAATGNNLHAALSLYEKNTRLSEAFYTPLQVMEVCLRNVLNRELTNAYGDNWFRNNAPPLEADAIISLQDKVTELTRARRTVATGAIVAEMSLGFWVGLLGPRYDNTLWRRALFRAFKEQGAGMRRDRVHGRFNAMRRFRNRIAHHEPIFLVNLANVHAEIIEATSWMCTTTAAWSLHQSRVREVLNHI